MLTLDEVVKSLNKTVDNVDAMLQKWRDVYYDISLHTSGAAPRYRDLKNDCWVTPTNYYGEHYQYRFNHRLLNKYPREEEEIRWWRFSQYRPFQKGAYGRIISVTAGAIFQDSNYSITLANKEDSDYINGNNFSGKSLVRYYQWALKCIMEDPNGRFIRIPKEQYDQTTTDRVEPDIWFVNSKDIVFISDEDIVFKRGDEGWWVNTVAIYKFTKQKGRFVLTEDNEGYFAHMLGYLPADYAGGEWNNQGYYDTWLAKSQPWADEFVSSKSNEQLVDKEASYPFIIMAQDDCETCQGIGRVQNEEGTALVTCPTCKGNRQKSNTPMQVLKVPAEAMKEDLIKIVSPSVDINKSHQEKNKQLMNDLLDSLSLLKVDASQSGVAKTIDLEQLHLFVSTISDDIFDRLITNTIRDIIAYRNVVAQNGVNKPAVYNYTIVKPTQFQIKTAGDLLSDYNDGIKAGIPYYIRSRMMVDYVDKQYGGDEVMLKKSKIIADMDPICSASTEEKQTLSVSGGCSQRDVQFSILLPNILEQVIRDHNGDWFLKATYEAIKTEVDKIFNAIKKPTQPIVITDVQGNQPAPANL